MLRGSTFRIAAGVTSATPQLSVAASSLNPGTYNGAVTFVALGATTPVQAVNVQLTVVALPPSVVQHRHTELFCHRLTAGLVSNAAGN